MNYLCLFTHIGDYDCNSEVRCYLIFVLCESFYNFIIYSEVKPEGLLVSVERKINICRFRLVLYVYVLGLCTEDFKDPTAFRRSFQYILTDKRLIL